MFNFHWVLFLLFKALSMETSNTVYFSLFLESKNLAKINPREKFLIYGIIYIYNNHMLYNCKTREQKSCKIRGKVIIQDKKSRFLCHVGLIRCKTDIFSEPG